MGEPDPKIKRLLQILCTPDAYRAITQNKRFSASDAGQEYWGLIPNYLISRCPFCGLAYFGQVDTYNLEERPRFNFTGYNITLVTARETPHCDHFLACHPFIHLNGNEPIELEYSEFWSGEVPGIEMGAIAETDIETLGVLHALPICRIERPYTGSEQFIPRYTAYFMVYFSHDSREIMRRFREGGENVDPEDAMHITFLCNPWRPEEYDLKAWVAKGKLKWLDLDNPDELPLRHGPPEDLPYANIEGRRKGFTYKNGVFRNRLT